MSNVRDIEVGVSHILQPAKRFLIELIFGHGSWHLKALCQQFFDSIFHQFSTTQKIAIELLWIGWQVPQHIDAEVMRARGIVKGFSNPLRWQCRLLLNVDVTLKQLQIR